MDGEVVLHFQKFFGGIVVGLGEGHIGDCVDYFQVVF